MDIDEMKDTLLCNGLVASLLPSVYTTIAKQEKLDYNQCQELHNLYQTEQLDKNILIRVLRHYTYRDMYLKTDRYSMPCYCLCIRPLKEEFGSLNHYFMFTLYDENLKVWNAGCQDTRDVFNLCAKLFLSGVHPDNLGIEVSKTWYQGPKTTCQN